MLILLAAYHNCKPETGVHPSVSCVLKVLSYNQIILLHKVSGLLEIKEIL